MPGIASGRFLTGTSIWSRARQPGKTRLDHPRTVIGMSTLPYIHWSQDISKKYRGIKMLSGLSGLLLTESSRAGPHAGVGTRCPQPHGDGLKACDWNVILADASTPQGRRGYLRMRHTITETLA